MYLWLKKWEGPWLTQDQGLPAWCKNPRSWKAPDESLLEIDQWAITYHVRPKDEGLTICAFVHITIGGRHKLLVASCFRITVAFLRFWQSSLGGQITGNISRQVYLFWKRNTHNSIHYYNFDLQEDEPDLCLQGKQAYRIHIEKCYLLKLETENSLKYLLF